MKNTSNLLSIIFLLLIIFVSLPLGIYLKRVFMLEGFREGAAVSVGGIGSASVGTSQKVIRAVGPLKTPGNQAPGPRPTKPK